MSAEIVLRDVTMSSDTFDEIVLGLNARLVDAEEHLALAQYNDLEGPAEYWQDRLDRILHAKASAMMAWHNAEGRVATA